MDEWQNWLPMWAHDSLDLMLVALQVGGIVLVAWLLRRSVGKLFDKIVAHHKVPVDVAVPMKTIGGWVIIVTAGMLVLERLGVSGQVLWTAITGFATRPPTTLAKAPSMPAITIKAFASLIVSRRSNKR